MLPGGRFPGNPEGESGPEGDIYEIRYVDLIRRRQQAALPPPMAQEPMLPLRRLDPEMFERLVQSTSGGCPARAECACMVGAARLITA